MALRKVQVKTVRAHPWYVKVASFSGHLLVLLGKEDAIGPVRYFIARNRDVEADVARPPNGATTASWG